SVARRGAATSWGGFESAQDRSGALTPWQIGKMAERSKGKAQREAGFPVAARDHSATEKATWQNGHGRWRNGQVLTTLLWLSHRCFWRAGTKSTWRTTTRSEDPQKGAS